MSEREKDSKRGREERRVSVFEITGALFLDYGGNGRFERFGFLIH